MRIKIKTKPISCWCGMRTHILSLEEGAVLIIDHSVRVYKRRIVFGNDINGRQDSVVDVSKVKIGHGIIHSSGTHMNHKKFARTRSHVLGTI